MGFFGSGFSASKCRTNLQLCLGRIRLIRNKRENNLKHTEKEVAKLLDVSDRLSFLFFSFLFFFRVRWFVCFVTAWVGSGRVQTPDKYEMAKIRVETVMNEEDMLEALSLVELFCELLVVRIRIIEQRAE